VRLALVPGGHAQRLDGLDLERLDDGVEAVHSQPNVRLGRDLKMVERPTLAGPALQSNKRVAGILYSRA